MNTTSSRQLCQRLLKVIDSAERQRLLEQVARTSECLDWCLEEARNATVNRLEEALPYSDLAIQIAQQRDDARSAAVAWRYRAQALRASARHLEAVAAFESAAECAHRAGDNRLAAQVQIGTINSLGWLGRYTEAFSLAKRLNLELSALGAHADAAKALVNAGNLHYRRDEYSDALTSYERALNTLADTGDEVAIARIQANCANTLARLNRVEESVKLFERAQATFTAQGDEIMAAMVDASAGYLHYLSGEHSAALTALTRARRVFSHRGQELETAKCDADMADVYREANLAPEALECYERAITVFQRLEIVYERANSELGRASILMTLERSEEAFAALQSAEALFARQQNRLQCAHTRLMHAYMLRSAGRPVEAVTEARRAAQVLARHQAGGLAASARLLMAEVALEQGADVSRQLHRVSREASRHSRRWLVCRAQRALGLHYARKAQGGRAIRHFRLGVAALEEARTLIASEEVHVAFLRDKLAIYEDLVGALLTRGRIADLEEALECVERSKSRLLVERIQTTLDRRSAGDTSTARHQGKLAALRAELSRSYHQIYAQEEGSSSRLLGNTSSEEALAVLERTYRAALRELEMADGETAIGCCALSRPISTKQLRAALQPDETLLEFYIVNNRIGAFVIDAKGMQVRRDVARFSDLAITARKLRFQLQRASLQAGYVHAHRTQMQIGVESALRELYDLLLAPLEPMLQSEKVIVVPHGILHGLPFHAFYDGADFVLDRYEFLYAPSAAIWHAGVQRRNAERPAKADAEGTLLIMGVPDARIARVAQEVEQVADLFPNAQKHCGESATVEVFRAHVGSCRLLHLATHALFRKDNPLFSGLRFADGWLLASDLYTLPMRCDLATLSACRTGTVFVEPGDELFGLIRGFLAAGAHSVAASLWPADDAATAALMVHFYTRLRQGSSQASALRAAQRETRNEFPHPYHWAPFAIIGER